MYPFSIIQEKPKTIAKLEKAGILKGYEKSKKLLLAGIQGKLDLKKRRPYGDGIYSFRINQKYRALGKIEQQVLTIFTISDHQ